MRSEMEALEERLVLSTYTVLNTNDSGAGSLRQAILDADGHSGVDTIAFSIGTGAQTISPLSALPDISDAVILDATTQPGYSGNPILELSGANCATQSNGLTLTAGSSTVKGLVINRWKSSGLASVNNGNNTIQNCYIGTDLTGLVAQPNSLFGIYAGTGGNQVGGAAAAARNVISGNASIGLFFNGGGGSTAQGNYIGLGADGVTRIGNGGTGLDCQDGYGNLIGGINPGEGNVISGNAQDGILLYGTANFTRIFGNLVGSDYTGTVPIGNHDWGLECQSANNLIGGNDVGARNLFSGNGASGIVLYSENVTQSTLNTVAGNYIGTDISGTRALGQSAWLGTLQQQGISFSFEAHDNLIGGTDPAARNIISGNVQGIGIFANAIHNTIQGNYIGTDHTGMTAIGNTNGIIIFGATDNTIGGTASGAGNLISASTFDGVLAGSDNTTIQGNLFGTSANGSGSLPNGEHDINTSNASHLLIGGPTTAARNVLASSGQDGIHFNGGSASTVQNNYIGVSADGVTPNGNQHSGIYFDGSSGNLVQGNVIRSNARAGIMVGAGTNNTFTGNSIMDNGALGIDLGADGVTPNAPGARVGANNLQNYPVLSGSTGGTVIGTLNAVASGTYTIEFYWSPTADPSGFGQGQTSLGQITVSTDSSGNANLSFRVPSNTLDGVISATATDAAGNTSEFSHVVAYSTGTSATVVNRAIFYNNSYFDGRDAGPDYASDNAAIATDKSALLPGQTATAANYTSYYHGINGIILDLANLGGRTPTAGDFSFTAANSTTPGSWPAAPAPASVTIFRGQGIGGSDRIELIWDDYAIHDTWLQVTLSTTHSGLAAPDTFYFGNLVGETGNNPTSAIVNTTDIAIAKLSIGPNIPITSIADFNRDGFVSTTDIAIAKLSVGHILAFPFTAPTPPIATPLVLATPAPTPQATSPTLPSAPVPVFKIGSAAPKLVYRLALPPRLPKKTPVRAARWRPYKN